MKFHKTLNDVEIRGAIRSKSVLLAGNSRLRIYGQLNCFSGKRMKRENRVFFTSLNEAKQLGYRPCHHCMPDQYKNWKIDAIV